MATVSGSMVNVVGVGSAVITASQAAGGNYGAAATNATLTVNAASNVISFPALSGVTYSNGLTVGLGASASSGLVVGYSTAATNVSISGTNVTVLGVGTAMIVASQSGNSNYVAATPVTNVLTIGQGSAGVTITGTSATYDGTGKGVSVVTVPSNLGVGVSYNGLTNLPTNAGNYSVVASVNDANYAGSSTATLTIGAAAPVLGSFTVGTKVYGAGTFLSLIHISEPTRPY